MELFILRPLKEVLQIPPPTHTHKHISIEFFLLPRRCKFYVQQHALKIYGTVEVSLHTRLTQRQVQLQSLSASSRRKLSRHPFIRRLFGCSPAAVVKSLIHVPEIQAPLLRHKRHSLVAKQTWLSPLHSSLRRTQLIRSANANVCNESIH